MHIAYLGIKGLPSAGGADRVVEALAGQLASRHTLTIYCSSQVTPPLAAFPGVRLVRIPALRGKYAHMTSVDFLAACHAILRGDYDLVHLHNLEASFTLPLLRLRYKTIATAHGRFTPSSKWGPAALAVLRGMERPFMYASTARTSVSALDAEALSQRFQRPVHYIPNGVELQPEVDIAAARRLIHSPVTDPLPLIVCAAGRILPLKGIHLALEAFGRLQASARLLIVGDLSQSPSYSSQLRQMAGERVSFLPFIPSRAVFLGLLTLSAVFVFPSLVEAMSMTLLEAASVGAPVLCSDIPANRAVMGGQAMYFQSGQAGDLLEKMETALSNPRQLAEIGQAGQHRVREQFSWERIARQYEALYDAVLSA